MQIKKESILLACNLVYPTSEPEREEWSFCDILTRSLCPKQTTPAWCDSCGKFTPTSQARYLQVMFYLAQLKEMLIFLFFSLYQNCYQLIQVFIILNISYFGKVKWIKL